MAATRTTQMIIDEDMYKVNEENDKDDVRVNDGDEELIMIMRRMIMCVSLMIMIGYC